jgi:translocator protein
MKIKPNYIIIPLITIATALLGSYFTNLGMPWYNETLIQPDLTPPKIAFPIAWNLIFLATTISALIIWKKGKKHENFPLIIGLFLFNAALNAFWCYLFFTAHLIQASFVEMIILETTLVLLITLSWRISRPASLLLLPYLLWVGLASYLTFQIFMLN